MQVPILNGIWTDGAADFRTAYPVNMAPIPKEQGISKGCLRPADGIVSLGTGPGIDRGGTNWNGTLYRVMGTKLVSVNSAGVATTIGDVGGTGQVRFAQGFGRLAIASGGHLFYWDGVTLSQVADPDLGTVLDLLWVDGYYMTTDGQYLVVTELADPTSVNPLWRPGPCGNASRSPDHGPASRCWRQEPRIALPPQSVRHPHRWSRQRTGVPMTDINRLSAVSSVSAGDQIPVFSTANGDARRAALSVLLAYLQANMTDAVAETLTASEYVKTTAVAVAALPAAATAGAGARATVTDSNATLTAGIGAVVAAGGANIVPVFSDGTNWRIG